MRARFFGAEASTARMTETLLARYPTRSRRWRWTFAIATRVERVFAERAGARSSW